MNAEASLMRAFARSHADEFARYAERLATAEFSAVLSALPVAQAAEIVTRVVPLAAASALAVLSEETATSLVLALEPRSAAAVLVRLSPEERALLLAALPAARATTLRALIDYGPTRAGGRMDPGAPMSSETLSIAEVLERVRGAAGSSWNHVYAVDAGHRLVGVVTLRELMVAAPAVTLAATMTREPERLFADDSLETIAVHSAWKRHHALPVVARDGRLLGGMGYITLRAIEAELGASRSVAPSAEAATALAELCAIGALALTRLVAVTVSSPHDISSGGRR